MTILRLMRAKDHGSVKQRCLQERERFTFQDPFRDLGFANDAQTLELSVPDPTCVRQRATPSALPETIGDNTGPARSQSLSFDSRVPVVILGEAACSTLSRCRE